MPRAKKAPPDQTPEDRIAQLEAQLRKIQRSQLLGVQSDFDEEEVTAALGRAREHFDRGDEFPHSDEEDGVIQCVKCREIWHTDLDGAAWGRTHETVGYGPNATCPNLVPNLGAPLPRNEAGEVIRQVPLQVCGGQLQYVELQELEAKGLTVERGSAGRRLHNIPPSLGRRGA